MFGVEERIKGDTLVKELISESHADLYDHEKVEIIFNEILRPLPFNDRQAVPFKTKVHQLMVDVVSKGTKSME